MEDSRTLMWTLNVFATEVKQRPDSVETVEFNDTSQHLFTFLMYN